MRVGFIGLGNVGSKLQRYRSEARATAPAG